MVMKTIENPCDGSGKCASDTGQCPDCNEPVTVNRSGAIRKHEGRYVPPQLEAEEPVHSVREMRDTATLLKIQLWHTFSISQDPRFKRLWQHALALETHLARIHCGQSYGSASVQLIAYQAGDVE